MHSGLMLLVAACFSDRGVSGDREVLSLSLSNWVHAAHTHLCKLCCSCAAQAGPSYCVFTWTLYMVLLLEANPEGKLNYNALDIEIK